jgi:D-arabinose 1-dehydrogenase-like Zn-dependent alcohol dehydrogenase
MRAMTPQAPGEPLRAVEMTDPREDGTAFLALAPLVLVRTTVTTYPLELAEQALADLRAGTFEGAAVLVP